MKHNRTNENKPPIEGRNEPHTITYQLDRLTVEMPVLGPEVEQARLELNALARQVYQETGSLDGARLREAEEVFSLMAAEKLRLIQDTKE